MVSVYIGEVDVGFKELIEALPSRIQGVGKQFREGLHLGIGVVSKVQGNGFHDGRLLGRAVLKLAVVSQYAVLELLL